MGMLGVPLFWDLFFGGGGGGGEGGSFFIQVLVCLGMSGGTPVFGNAIWTLSPKNPAVLFHPLVIQQPVTSVNKTPTPF